MSRGFASYTPPGHTRRHVGVSTHARPGRCRFCRCTEYEPCPPGCAWADRAQTLCTECTYVALAWEALPVAHQPNMVRAFFRGYVAGAGDLERATEVTNPYRPGATAKYWAHGHAAGKLVAV